MQHIIPEQLTGKQLETLHDAIKIINEDISAVEKIIGSILIEANKKKETPVIGFCHDVLQSLRLIPIYTRNVLTKLPSNGENGGVLRDDAKILLEGLLATVDEALILKPSNAYMENLPAIISDFCSRDDYFTFGIEAQLAKLHIMSIKLSQSALKVLNVIKTS